MRFDFAIINDMNSVLFRSHDYIYEDNKTGFFITQGQDRLMGHSVNLHDDHRGGDIKLLEDLDLSQEIRIYYGDRDWVRARWKTSLLGSDSFSQKFTYDGPLGSFCDGATTSFRVWSPLARRAVVNLYRKGEDTPFRILGTTAMHKGIHETALHEDLHGVYYTYTLDFEGEGNAFSHTCTDPYAKACGINGNKSMVVNLSLTNPQGFIPSAHIGVQHPTDAVIYEAHIRDFTIWENSGVDPAKRGRYTGFIQPGTRSPEGEKTGLDHLAELGITHVHLLPVMDFYTVDESHFDTNQYNWGYDPHSYFCLEGGYSCDASDGALRIYEFKQLVQALHGRGIGVVLDVVYNHTCLTEDSNLNLIMPDYYYRHTETGQFSNGSGCGNELCTENAMVRKLILDSVEYWVREYGVDGFRFDLMGLIDVDTMNMIRRRLDEIHPGLLVYGEGWTAGDTPLPNEKQSTKHNAFKLSGPIAFFNDEYRDVIKGNTFLADQPGYVVQGRDPYQDAGYSESIEAGVVGQIPHPDVFYTGDMSSFAIHPTHTVNYFSAHDNYTLHDKLRYSAAWAGEAELMAMYKLCMGMVMTAQGIPFIMGGEEFMRSKPLGNGQYAHDSYNSPDWINHIDWSLKRKNKELFEYLQGLIAFRREHPALRIPEGETVRECVRFLPAQDANRVIFAIDGTGCGDALCELLVIFNPTTHGFIYHFGQAPNQMCINDYQIYADKYRASAQPLYAAASQIYVEPVSLMILGR